MAQGKPQLKFERNPCIKFRDNCDTDGRTTGRTDDGRTTDGRTDGRTTDKLRFHELCWHSQAELKIVMFDTNIYTADKSQTVVSHYEHIY